MNSRSTDCEADALTTTPSRRFQFYYFVFISKTCAYFQAPSLTENEKVLISKRRAYFVSKMDGVSKEQQLKCGPPKIKPMSRSLNHFSITKLRPSKTKRNKG